MSWDGVLGRMSIDAKTHQLVRPYFVVRCKAVAEMKSPADFAEIVALGDKQQPADQNQCKGMAEL